MLMHLTLDDGTILDVITLGGRGICYNSVSETVETIPGDDVTPEWFTEHEAMRPATVEEAEGWAAEHNKGPLDYTEA